MKVVYRCTYRPVFTIPDGSEVRGRLLVCHLVANDVFEAGAILTRQHMELAKLEHPAGTQLEKIVLYECAWARLAANGGIIDFRPVRANEDWIGDIERRDEEMEIAMSLPRCVICGVLVGGQHRPSCDRQGMVSGESLL